MLHILAMFPRGRFWTVPNVLSLSRLALLPVFIYALSEPGMMWLAGALVFYGVVSDLLDGYLARRLNQITEWGKLIDPVSDKITVAVALLFCYFNRGLPLWLLLLILSRDFVILIMAPVLARRFGTLPPSNMAGRLTALSFGLLALVYILEFKQLITPLTVVALALLAVSSVSYGRRIFAHAD